MEIPGNELSVKNKAIQDRIKVSGKESAKTDASRGSSGTKGTQGSEHIALSSKAKDIQKAGDAKGMMKLIAERTGIDYEALEFDAEKEGVIEDS